MTPSFNERQESIALLSEDEVHPGEKAVLASTNQHSSFFSTRTIPLLLLIDFITLVYFITHLAPLPLESLPLRNSYVGLAELYATQHIKSSRHDSIVNKPLFAAQISNSEPYKVFPQDEHEWLSLEGTLAPPDRHTLLSKHIRTIYQFRAMDFGMDSCQLALRLPMNSSWSDIDMNQCRPDSTEPMDVHKLSWKSKPRCETYAGAFRKTNSQEQTLTKFDCEWGKIYNFEAKCSDCDVDVWSNQNETWGIFMYQHQTI